MPRCAATVSSLVLVSLLAGVGGCANSTHDTNPALTSGGRVHTPPKAVAKASDSQRSALLDRIKSLEGTWESTDDKGQKHISSVFTVTSAGSAVREVMLPGTPHEMTNMYTMDGPTLVVTHYCAMGNQPRMRSVDSPPDRIHLAYDGVGNFAGGDQMYMGDLTIVFKDADHITTSWRSFQDGKPSGHDPDFELTRRH
jgi:hypothetical protein